MVRNYFKMVSVTILCGTYTRHGFQALANKFVYVHFEYLNRYDWNMKILATYQVVNISIVGQKDKGYSILTRLNIKIMHT